MWHGNRINVFPVKNNIAGLWQNITRNKLELELLGVDVLAAIQNQPGYERPLKFKKKKIIKQCDAFNDR